jgi:hypothetical protein
MRLRRDVTQRRCSSHRWRAGPPRTSTTVDLSRPDRGGHETLGFFLIFFLIFCVGWVLERRDRRRKTKEWERIASRRAASGVAVHEHPMTPLTPPSAPAPAPRQILQFFGDGVFEVGIDIAPGTYRSGGKSPLETAWRRLSDFSGTGVIASGASTGPCIVTIETTDRGFESRHSGVWHPVNPPLGPIHGTGP